MNTTKSCDHTSVGMLVWRSGKLLLLERRKPPFGFAPPAGHVDDHGSFEDAARIELYEEVGLLTNSLELVIEGKKDNRCRRKGGTWHYWKIYDIDAEGEVKRSEEETNRTLWCSPEDLDSLKLRSDRYLCGMISKSNWRSAPGLEPVWSEWLTELGVFGKDGVDPQGSRDHQLGERYAIGRGR